MFSSVRNFFSDKESEVAIPFEELIPKKPREEHLVARWNFAAQQGKEVADSGPLKCDATVFGSPSGKYFLGNGQDSFVEVHPHTALENLQTGSISLWFCVHDVPEGAVAPLLSFGSSTPCTLMRDAANKGIVIEVGHGSIRKNDLNVYYTVFGRGCFFPTLCFDSNDQGITKNTWHHVVVSVSQKGTTGFLDGRELFGRRYNFGNAQKPQFFSAAKCLEVLWFGKGFWSSREVFLDGKIREVQIFKNPLSAEEVKFLYEKGTEKGSVLSA